MATGNLTALQARILEVLARVEPPWTLTGGGAMVGFHASHRMTKDIDLFWREHGELEDAPRKCADLLAEAGLEVEPVQSSKTFVRWRVKRGSESCLVDLVADPVHPVHPPITCTIGASSFQVDPPREILINKLVALLGRSEIRDLADLKHLLEMGLDLNAGLEAAPRKDGGFSPLTLAWLLRSFPMQKLAEREKLAPEEFAVLEDFRAQLVKRLIAMANPGDQVFERP